MPQTGSTIIPVNFLCISITIITNITTTIIVNIIKLMIDVTVFNKYFIKLM